MSVIKGNAYWASIVSPNTTFDSDGVWSIDVGNLDKKNIEIAKMMVSKLRIKEMIVEILLLLNVKLDVRMVA